MNEDEKFPNTCKQNQILANSALKRSYMKLIPFPECIIQHMQISKCNTVHKWKQAET